MDPKAHQFPQDLRKNRAIAVGSFGWIDKILWAGLISCLAVAVARAGGAEKVSILENDVSLDQAWWLILILTFAHGYAAWVAIRACYLVYIGAAPPERRELHDEIVSKGGVFVRGMSARQVAAEGFSP